MTSNSKKRRLSKEELCDDEAQPPLKKLKIAESDNLLTINCDKFLDIIVDKESKASEKWTDVEHLILKCDDSFDYNDVYLKYVDVIAEILPKLKRIQSPFNFLFRFIGKEMDYLTNYQKPKLVQQNPSLFKAVFKNLEEVYLTGCMHEADIAAIENIQSCIKCYPSLKLINTYCFKVDCDEFAKNNVDISHIKLYAHLPNVMTQSHKERTWDINHVPFDAAKKEFGLDFIHKPWRDFKDPRSSVDRNVDSRGEKRFRPLSFGDFTKIWVGTLDCGEKHTEMWEEDNCDWCRLFKERSRAVECITVNGIRYKNPPERYNYNDNDTYDIQFPVDIADNFNGCYFYDGLVFWGGMPDGPEPCHTFEHTILFRRNPKAFEVNTVYYLTHQQCDLLRSNSRWG